MSTTASTVTAPAERVTETLAGFASRLRFEDLDAPARTVARHCLMDWLGVAIAGADDETTRIVRDEALAEGGAAQSTIVLSERRSVLQAALVNGTAGHALDFDDVHYAMPGHPSAAVAPAVMALAERDGASGEEVIAAFVAGVEIACRVGRYMTGRHYDQGWHATGTVGTFGAAAAAARLLGLGGEATTRALGIAGTQAAGLKAMFGTMCKPMHAGKAASNGLQAALLAARGFTARPNVLECEQGFGATQTPAVDPEAALEGLGSGFMVRDVLFKYHAACYGTHAAIDAARALARTQDIAPERIAKVEIRVKPRYLAICNIERPATGLEAKFSLRMTAAMALAGVATDDPNRYDEDLCKEPALRAIIDRTHVVGSDDLGDGMSEVVVSMSDGVVYRLRGDVSEPAGDLAAQGARLESKFDTLVAPPLGRTLAAELRGLLAGLDGLSDVRALMALTRA